MGLPIRGGGAGAGWGKIPRAKFHSVGAIFVEKFPAYGQRGMDAEGGLADPDVTCHEDLVRFGSEPTFERKIVSVRFEFRTIDQVPFLELQGELRRCCTLLLAMLWPGRFSRVVLRP